MGLPDPKGSRRSPYPTRIRADKPWGTGVIAFPNPTKRINLKGIIYFPQSSLLGAVDRRLAKASAPHPFSRDFSHHKVWSQHDRSTIIILSGERIARLNRDDAISPFGWPRFLAPAGAEIRQLRGDCHLSIAERSPSQQRRGNPTIRLAGISRATRRRDKITEMRLSSFHRGKKPRLERGEAISPFGWLRLTCALSARSARSTEAGRSDPRGMAEGGPEDRSRPVNWTLRPHRIES